jgi:hypothetical protein
VQESRNWLQVPHSHTSQRPNYSARKDRGSAPPTTPAVPAKIWCAQKTHTNKPNPRHAHKHRGSLARSIKAPSFPWTRGLSIGRSLARSTCVRLLAGN